MHWKSFTSWSAVSIDVSDANRDAVKDPPVSGSICHIAGQMPDVLVSGLGPLTSPYQGYVATVNRRASADSPHMSTHDHPDCTPLSLSCSCNESPAHRLFVAEKPPTSTLLDGAGGGWHHHGCY